MQDRMSNVMNGLHREYEHSIVSISGDYGCKSRLSADGRYDFPLSTSESYSSLSDILAIRAALKRIKPDLLCTYNWGAVDWAMTSRMFPLCPHIHLESGFGAEEADGQFRRRVLFRRLALARVSLVIVPSRTLARIATEVWKLDPKIVARVPNGVDCRKFSGARSSEKILGFEKAPEELIVGTVAALRPEKNLGLLIDAMAALKDRSNVRLMIVGDGSERASLEDRAERLGIGKKVVFTGQVDQVDRILGLIDVFALTSRTEQMPFGILQAMAAGKPIAAVDVGDVSEMLPPENRSLVVPRDDLPAFTETLNSLLRDADMRRGIGEANQAHVRATYPLEAMVETYESIFSRFALPD